MHRVLSLGAVLALGALLAACSTADLKKAFPRIAAGFEDGGVVGAIDGATSGLLLICQRLDGEEVRVALDMSAAAWGATDDLERVREIRRAGCASIGAAHILVGGVLVPAAGVQAIAPVPPAKPAESAPEPAETPAP